MTEQITALLVGAAVGIPQSKPFAIREPRSGSRRVLAAVVANAWLGNRYARDTQQRTRYDARCRVVKELDLFESNHGCALNVPS